MPRRAKAKGLYHRGHYRLDWDRRRDGTLRSPYLAIFWYDADRGRERSASTGTGDIAEAKAALDRHYLANTTGEAFCPTCGQRRAATAGFLVTQAVADYLAVKASADPAIAHRIAHIISFIAETGRATLTCRQFDEAMAKRFRDWISTRPIANSDRDRAPSTIENSLIQLAAAIRMSHRRGDSPVPPQFRPIPTTQLNRSPQHRSDVGELARMFAYAIDPRFPVKRAALHRFLIAAVATMARPEEVHDISTDPAREQWNSTAQVLNLNPRGRRQTRKYRATIKAPWQLAQWLDARPKQKFVGVGSVKSAWEAMAADIGLPGDGEAGMKLIRRSMATLLRNRLPKADWPEIEMWLGHDRFDTTSAIYAPFDPDYLAAARAEIEAVLNEIEVLVPGAIYRINTGDAGNVIPLQATKKAR